VKVLFHSLILAALISPLILAQTTHSFLETFDSGNAEGWAFYTDASVSVQNGQLNVVGTGTGFQIAHIYPPIGATINDFSIEVNSDAASVADGGFIGRNGFNSLIGLLFDDDTVKVVHAENITDYMNPPFVTLAHIRLYDYSLKTKFSVQKSGTSLIVNTWINDTLKHSGTIQNAPLALLKGQILISVVGEQMNFKLGNVNIQYNPFIQSQTGTYNDSFDDPATPWIKMGTWETVASAVTISNGNINFNHSGSSLASLYVATPLGAVSNYELSLTGSGTMGDGNFSVWRVYSYKYYTGMWTEDDRIKVGYLSGDGIVPIAVNSAPVVFQGISWFRFVTTNSGNTITMSVYGDNNLLVTGNLITNDSRLHSGHVVFGVDVWDSVNIYYSEISMLYNRFVTDIHNDGLPGSFALMQNYPNPFNSSTMIEYELVSDAHVQLEVFDILGRECETLVREYQSSGKHSVNFDASGLLSGIYFYKLTTTPADGSKGLTELKKLVLLK